MVSFSALAQEADILRLADDIKDEIRFQTHDRRTLIRAQRNLEQALAILRGSQPAPGPGRSTLTCVDRDRDGRDPYVLGFLDPRTLSTTRIERANVGSLDQCRRIVASSINLGRGTTLSCITRDNDGRDPWAPAIIQDGRVAKVLPTLSTVEECVNSISQSISNRFAVSLCVSRDNDGRAPYMRVSYELSNGNVNNGASYSTLEECQLGN